MMMMTMMMTMTMMTMMRGGYSDNNLSAPETSNSIAFSDFKAPPPHNFLLPHTKKHT